MSVWQHKDLSTRYITRHITKSTSAAGSASRWLRNRSTCIQGAFRHITKSPSAAVCTRRPLGNIVIAF